MSERRGPCLSRTRVFRYWHEFDKDRRCIFCDRTESQIKNKGSYIPHPTVWPINLFDHWRMGRENARRRVYGE